LDESATEIGWIMTSLGFCAIIEMVNRAEFLYRTFHIIVTG